jgi:hypothetical protein
MYRLPAVSGRRREQRMAFCGNCGNEIPEGTRFCPNCGAPVVNGQNNMNLSENKGNEGGINAAGQQSSYGNQPGAGQQSPNGSQPGAGQQSSNGSQPGAGQQSSYGNQSSGAQQGSYDSLLPDFQGQPSKSGSGRAQDAPASGINRHGKVYGIVLFILALVSFLANPPILSILLSAAVIAGAVFCISKKYKRKGFCIAAIVLGALSLVAGVSQGSRYGMLATSGKDSASVSAGTEQNAGSSTAEQAKPSATPAASDSRKTESAAQNTSKAEPASGGNSGAAAADAASAEGTEGAADAGAAESTQQASGVSPDLKEYLDSYEAFIDEYVEFMKRYNSDPGNSISMMTEYIEMMGKYAEFAEKIGEYESAEMSDADFNYYLEVTTRCTQKLLEASSAQQ